MKAEERHELRENDLAGWLQYGLVNWLREYGSYVLLLGALAFLGYRLWVMHEEKKTARYQEAFNTLHEAEAANAGKETEYFRVVNPADPKQLADLIDSTEFMEVKAEAAIALAQYYHDMVAFPEILRMKNLRRDEVLDKAMTYYQTAAKALPNDRLVNALSQLGIAAVYEDQLLWDKAREIYTAMGDPKSTYAGTPMADVASARLKSLPDRQNAPRLVAQIPEIKPAAPSSPSMMPDGSMLNGSMQIPGLPRMPSMPGPVLPYQGPSFPGIGPDIPSTAPASAPAASLPSILGPLPERGPTSAPATAPEK
ncbi:MAG TPA: hypothetical protein VHM90_18995 [Phycisphaerae bacterium]|jgi:hypothetical protein|nr:hypothetical protein [Phycisphaerae bacterium]